MHLISDVSAIVKETMPKSRKEILSHHPAAFPKGLLFDEKMHFLLALFRLGDFFLTKKEVIRVSIYK